MEAFYTKIGNGELVEVRYCRQVVHLCIPHSYLNKIIKILNLKSDICLLIFRILETSVFPVWI